MNSLPENIENQKIGNSEILSNKPDISKEQNDEEVYREEYTP